jgi:ACS family hexuronate transporter-like MFS transporter
MIAKALGDPVWWFFLIWLPDFFSKAHGMNLKRFGPALVVIYSIAMLVSIAGARLSDYLIQWGWSVNKSRKISLLAVAIVEFPLLLLVKGSGVWTAVVLLGLACGAHQAWAANLFTSVSDMFPKKAVATVTGLGGMAACVSSFFFQIYAGSQLDAYAQNASRGYGGLFAICGSAYLVAFFLNHLLANRFEPIRLRDSIHEAASPA